MAWSSLETSSLRDFEFVACACVYSFTCAFLASGKTRARLRTKAATRAQRGFGLII